MDLLAKILIFSAFAMPLFTLYWVWKRSQESKIVKFLIGLSLGIVLGFLCYGAALLILLRNGLGPT